MKHIINVIFKNEDIKSKGIKLNTKEIFQVLGRFPEFVKRGKGEGVFYTGDFEYYSSRYRELLCFFEEQLHIHFDGPYSAEPLSGKRFSVSRNRYWDEVDYFLSKWFMINPDCYWLCPSDIVKQVDGIDFYAIEDFEREEDAADEVGLIESGGFLCDAETKDLLEKENFKNIVFKEIRFVDSDLVLWEICSQKYFPKFKDEWVTVGGVPFDEKIHKTRSPKGDGFVPHQYLFSEDEVIEEIGDFDVAQCPDLVEFIVKDSRPPLICSRRFRQWFEDYGIRVTTQPFTCRFEPQNY